MNGAKGVFGFAASTASITFANGAVIRDKAVKFSNTEGKYLPKVEITTPGSSRIAIGGIDAAARDKGAT